MKAVSEVYQGEATVGGDVGEVALLLGSPHADHLLAALQDAGIPNRIVSPIELGEAIRSAVLGAVVMDETCLSQPFIVDVEAAIADQPAWSNLPVILILDRDAVCRRAETIEKLGNVGLAEHPFDRRVFLPALRAALRSRRRQREAQANLAQREEAEARFQRLTENLEARVMARTNELRAANERMLTEIDERRRAEDRLRESEELHRFTVELGQQLVWTASPEGRLSSLSPRFSELTGLDRKVDPHEGWLAVIHPDDYQRTLDVSALTFRSGKPNATEFRMRMRDGSYRRFLARAAPRKDEQGRIIRWYGYTQDIEGQRSAEDRLRESEQRYRLAARATNDAIWDLDLITDELHWSESASDTLGYPGRPLGTTSLEWWEERLHPEDRQQALDSLQKAISKGKNRWSSNYRFRRANGEYAIFFDRGFIQRDDKGTPVRFVGAMTDLSERHKADEELRRMQAELIHVSRLSAMGTMASTLAHELNQPLTAVTNYVRGSRRLIANGDGTRLDEVRDALGAAEAGALRAGQIVRRLRELVARGNAAIRPEELPKLIEDACGIGFLDAHLLGVSHRVELGPDAQWVEVDRIQVQQVLINLIRNSMQAMQGANAKEIIISTRRASPQEVEVCVSDTGEGIPPEVRDALFSAFQGTKAEGMGIGLSISRTIIEAHGGKIWAEDREGGGSVFRFTLSAWEPIEDE